MKSARSVLVLASLVAGLGGVTGSAAASPTDVIAGKGGGSVACRKPTLQDCASTAYRDSACGQQTAAECKSILEAGYKADYTASGFTQVISVADGKDELGQVVKPSISGFMAGGTSTYGLIVQQNQLIAVQGLSCNPTPNGQGLPTDFFENFQLITDPEGAAQVTEFVPMKKRGYPSTLLGGLPIADDKLVSCPYDPHEAWKTNGPRVSSCEEYVYKKFYDFSAFQDAAAKLGDNYRGILQMMLTGDSTIYTLLDKPNVTIGLQVGPMVPRGLIPGTPHSAAPFVASPPGLANRVQRDFYGNPIADIYWPITGQGPNPFADYFSFDISSMPSGFAPYPYRETPPRSTKYFFWPDWNTLTAPELARTETDDTFAKHFAKNRAYEELATTRMHTWGTYLKKKKWSEDCKVAAAAGTLSPAACGDPAALAATFAAKLSAIDAQLDGMRQEAIGRGCYDGVVFDDVPCDWQPRKYVHYVMQQIIARQNKAYKACHEVMGDFWSTPGSVPSQARNLGFDAAGVPAGSDVTASVYAVDGFILKMQTWIDSLPLPQDAMGKPRVGDQHSASDHWGSSWFGVDYDYALGWEFADLDKDFDLAQFDVGGSFNVTGHALTLSHPLIGGTVHAATANEDEITHDIDVSILGESVFADHGTTHVEFNVAQDYHSTKEFFSLTVPFPCGPVPCSLTGGLTGTVGMSVDVSGGVKRNHAAHEIAIYTTGALTPYAHVDAFADAGLDVGLASAGVGGELRLLGIDLPLTTQMAVKAVPGRDGLILDGDTNLKLNLRSMDGRLYVYVKLFHSYEKQFDIVSWTGAPLVDGEVLFDLKYPVVPLGLLQTRLRTYVPGGG